jgi:serine/threonine protein kinase
MITHDRWQRIKEIFYSAQDRTPAERSDFLDEVCGDDASMREEVEALLTADADNDNFLTSPAYEFAAGMLDDEPSEFIAGQTFGRYEILCPLGAGGMGQIYLARDTQLGRNIALKLIAQEFATDSRRVLRFEQEARAASALNHPNVCVIHEIGITDTGRHFIAMEHIQGATLRDHLARGPLKLPEALQIAMQVGAALSSAHAVGIVHRDIKPENIMLRPDGYVKVVDFGLAKLTELLPDQQPSDEAQTVVQTEPRTLMGTVKYMSPEQLRERTIDERTDIWSLGIVLYEMLTGSTPFDARSRNESVALILNAEPAKLTFPEEVPIRYRQIVKKALEKDANKRYQTITKLTSDLTRLKRELERNAETFFGDIQPSLVGYTPRVRLGSTIFTRLKSQALSTADTLFTEIKIHKRAAIFAGTTGVLGLVLILPAVTKWVKDTVNPPKPVQQETRVVPVPDVKALTNSGTSVCSAISFDGKWVAHAEEQNGKQRLLVMNMASHDSSIAVPPDDVQYLGVTFSRDNNYLYFTRQEKTGPGILYRLALLGSNPIKLKTGVDGPISFSPQGERFAFVRHDKENSQFFLMLSNVDGSNEQVLATRKNGDRLSIYGPAWSPDGNLVVCPTSHWDNGFHMQLVGFDPKDGREQLIGSRSWFSLFEVAWQGDMSSLVVSARDRETSPHQLWRIHFPDGAAKNITYDLNDYRGVSIFGDQIVTVKTTQSSRMWVVSLDEPQAPTLIASGVGVNYGLTWTRKNKIVFSSMAGDRLNITRIDPDGSNQIPLTHEGDNYTPAASADGRFIVFSSNRNGAFNIWRINADDGSDATQLTFTDGNFYPSCSPDNQWIAYDSIANSEANVWKVPMNGGDSIKVCEKYRMPVFSPDSQFIACRSNIESDSRDVAIFSAQGGPPLRHVAIPIQDWQRIQWLSDHELSFIKYKDGYSNIWSYDLDTGASKPLTNFNSDRIYAYAWSPDFKQIACQRGTNVSDVTMFSER